MSSPAGVIVSISGSALVRTKTEQGEEQLVPAYANQTLQAGDTIVTADHNVTLTLDAGEAATVTLPPNSQLVVPDSPESLLQQRIEEQVADLQAQLLNEDIDPDDLEATAAGESTPNSTDDSGDFGQPAPLLALDEPDLFSARGTDTTNISSPSVPDEETDTPANTSNSLEGFIDNSAASLNSFHSVTEDFRIETHGQLNTSLSTAQNIATQYGTLTVDTSGAWQYRLDNHHPDIQGLGAGDTLSETIRLAGQQLQFTIHGSNDLARITGDNQGFVQDIGDDLALPTPTAQGQLLIEDSDVGEARFVVEFGKTTRFGELDIGGNGDWTYRLNTELDAVRGLAEGETVSDYISIATLDGSRHTLRIDIEGSNHAPQIYNEFSPHSDPVMPNGFNINLAEESAASGKLGILDPDFGESHFLAQNSIKTQYGLASIDSEGNWQYQLDTTHSKIGALSEGEVVRDFVRVRSADDTPYDLIFTVHGSDQPAFSASSTALFDAQDDQLLLSQSSHSDSSELYIWQPDTHNEVEHIVNFHPGNGGDTLVLNELLFDDSSHPENSLHFAFDGEHTTIEFTATGADSTPQQLVLDHTDLSQFGSSDAEIIQNLIQQGNLDIASAS